MKRWSPLGSRLVGVAFAHEVFGAAQALGVLLVLGGVLLGQRVRRPTATPVQPVVERALTMSR